MIKIYEEEDGWVGVTYSKELEVYLMHVEITKWSLSEYKRYLKIFGVLLNELKKVTPEIYSLCRSEKQLKFNELFGFKPTELLVKTTDGEVVMLARLIL